MIPSVDGSPALIQMGQFYPKARIAHDYSDCLGSAYLPVGGRDTGERSVKFRRRASWPVAAGAPQKPVATAYGRDLRLERRTGIRLMERCPKGLLTINRKAALRRPGRLGTRDEAMHRI
jgi:hypothetical protein